MHLAFDSIEDLKDFLKWATSYGPTFTETVIDLPKTHPAHQASPQEMTIDLGGMRVPDVVQQSTDAPAKRKRRTQAEIAADKAAAEKGGPADPLANQAPQNPFAASAPAADAALTADQGKTGLTTATGPSRDEITAKAAEYLADGSADDPMLHLTSSRHVMDKHKLDVFRSTLEGLPGNIVEHTREQRAEHMARLWALG